MKLTRALAASVLLIGLLLVAAPAEAGHHHSRGCHHRTYYSHSHRPYYGYRSYDPYYYSYRPVRVYSPYYVAPARVIVPPARLYVHPHVDIHLGF